MGEPNPYEPQKIESLPLGRIPFSLSPIIQCACLGMFYLGCFKFFLSLRNLDYSLFGSSSFFCGMMLTVGLIYSLSPLHKYGFVGKRHFLTITTSILFTISLIVFDVLLGGSVFSEHTWHYTILGMVMCFFAFTIDKLCMDKTKVSATESNS